MAASRPPLARCTRACTKARLTRVSSEVTCLGSSASPGFEPCAAYVPQKVFIITVSCERSRETPRSHLVMG
eukprot:scaffold49025_cov60-Phaeocystis_antarctica.AAC.1